MKKQEGIRIPSGAPRKRTFVKDKGAFPVKSVLADGVRISRKNDSLFPFAFCRRVCYDNGIGFFFKKGRDLYDFETRAGAELVHAPL